MPPNHPKKGALKIKFTVILGYLLVMAVMAVGFVGLYHNLVNYSNRRIGSEDMPALLIVGNTLSMLYEIESEQNLINAENAELYFHKYDSIVPKIRHNLDDLKQSAIDSLRITKLDTIRWLIDRKRDNLQEVALLLDSIRRSPEIVVQIENNYVHKELNREIAQYLEDKTLDGTNILQSDTSVLVGGKRGLFDRVRDVFVARSDSTFVIEKKSTVSENDFKLIIDTIINKVLYSERLDLQRQRQFQLAYLARQEIMSQTNRMLTSRIDDLLKGIEQEELEKSIRLLAEKERTISGSQRIMFIAFCVAMLIAFVFALLFLVDINRSQRYRKQLEASNKRISDLLASREKLMLTISHDIKAPMSSILGFIELMDTHGNRESESYLRKMKKSGEHILELASALLDYHRLEKGGWQLKESNIHLHALVEDTASGFAPLAARKGLKYTVDNQLPAECVAYSDPYMVCQIMHNIISNAIKYTPEGSVLVSARLSTDGFPKQLLFSVADTGTGIDAAEQQLIFREFTQLDNSFEKEGSGLGLAITVGFVEALEGSIRLHSRKGEGSEFMVALPLKDAVEDAVEDAMEEAVQRREEPEATPYYFEGVSALLVDDDPIQLTMTSEMLARMKIKSVTEENPAKVLPLLQSIPFDILLMDIQMPGTDGLALLGTIRRLENHRIKTMPVIGLSARTDMPEEEMKAAGFTDFLTKPFTYDKLCGMIRKYVGDEILLEDTLLSSEESASEEKGPRALIEFVSDDTQTSVAILQSFIDETGENRTQLEKAFQEKEETRIREIAHKILPLFRLMGDRWLTNRLEMLENGEELPDSDALWIWGKIDNYLKEATTLRDELNDDGHETNPGDREI